MFKKFSYILYKLIKLIDLIFIKILKKSFFSWFKEFIEDDISQEAHDVNKAKVLWEYSNKILEKFIII